jgi:micrococcal nuclease
MYTKHKTTIILISIFLLLFSFIGYCQSLPMYLPYGYSIKSKVVRVIDGDTFVLSDSQHVRILGINTPAIARLNKPAEPFADSAQHFIKSLIEGKQVKLTFNGKTYDIFGRLLAYVWLTNINGKDSLFIQAELLKAGLCRISHYPKGKRYYDLFYNLRRTAIKNRLGIWKHD